MKKIIIYIFKVRCCLNKMKRLFCEYVKRHVNKINFKKMGILLVVVIYTNQLLASLILQSDIVYAKVFMKLQIR